MTISEPQANQVESLVLRFRDLVTDQGSTVQQHDEIAEKKGSVWWGWWNKFAEQVPINTFDRLAGLIATSGNPLDILLLDSGQNKLYSTTCHEICWQHGRVKIGSPDPELTPSYYRTETYFAWFKLDRITSYRY
jgi:hypothetical protein